MSSLRYIRVQPRIKLSAVADRLFIVVTVKAAERHVCAAKADVIKHLLQFFTLLARKCETGTDDHSSEPWRTYGSILLARCQSIRIAHKKGALGGCYYACITIVGYGCQARGCVIY